MSERMWLSEELEKTRTERDALRAENERWKRDYQEREDYFQRLQRDQCAEILRLRAENERLRELIRDAMPFLGASTYADDLRIRIAALSDLERAVGRSPPGRQEASSGAAGDMSDEEARRSAFEDKPEPE